MNTTKFFVGRVWHAGQPRLIPSTDRRFRARIFWREGNVSTEQLCGHEHLTEVEAFQCGVAMAAAANEETI